MGGDSQIGSGRERPEGSAARGSSRRAVLGAAGAAMLTSCTSAEAGRSQEANPFEQLERDLGGRLGLCCLDASGRVLAAHRADERFALCSTFKAPLAGAILSGANEGRWSIDDEVAITEADLLEYAPVARAALERGSLTLAELCEGTIQLSDNTAANLLLRQLGGPQGLTDFFRSRGDQTSRLDRFEPELNENLPGDPRDTTTPRALVELLQGLLGEDTPESIRAPLREWMLGCRTGARRLRAGVPRGWAMGNKTGTAPQNGPMFCDLGFFEPARDRGRCVVAVFSDRATVSRTEVESAIAQVAEWCAATVILR